MGLFSFNQRSPVPERNTIPGKVRIGQLQGLGDRDSQQDSFAVSGADCQHIGMLAVVADGMGGLVNSGQISSAVVEAVSDAYIPGSDAPASTQLLTLARSAIQRSAALTKDLTYKSGTTMIACILQNGGLSWMSIGDSRLCLWRNGGLIQLNRDHNFAHDLLVLTIGGQMTPEQAFANPRREALTSCISQEFPRYFDFNLEPVSLLSADRVILMSDGVYRTLTEQELCVALEQSADKSADLIKRQIEAKALPQQDNFTAVILEVL